MDRGQVLPTPCHTGRCATETYSSTKTLSHRAAHNINISIQQRPVTPGGARHKRIHPSTPCHTGRCATQTYSSTNTLSHRAARNTNVFIYQNKTNERLTKKNKKNQGLDFFIFCKSRRLSLQSEILGFFNFFNFFNYFLYF